MANLTFAVNTKHKGNLISTSHIRNKQVLEWGRSWDTLPCYVLYLWLVLLEMVPHWHSLQKTKLLILIEMDWHLKQKFAIAWCSGQTMSSCIVMTNSEVCLHHKSQNKMIYHNVSIVDVNELTAIPNTPTDTYCRTQHTHWYLLPYPTHPLILTAVPNTPTDTAVPDTPTDTYCHTQHTHWYLLPYPTHPLILITVYYNFIFPCFHFSKYLYWIF